jgi:hypothetical protein
MALRRHLWRHRTVMSSSCAPYAPQPHLPCLSRLLLSASLSCAVPSLGARCAALLPPCLPPWSWIPGPSSSRLMRACGPGCGRAVSRFCCKVLLAHFWCFGGTTGVFRDFGAICCCSKEGRSSRESCIAAATRRLLGWNPADSPWPVVAELLCGFLSRQSTSWSNIPVFLGGYMEVGDGVWEMPLPCLRRTGVRQAAVSVVSCWGEWERVQVLPLWTMEVVVCDWFLKVTGSFRLDSAWALVTCIWVPSMLFKFSPLSFSSFIWMRECSGSSTVGGDLCALFRSTTFAMRVASCFWVSELEGTFAW